MRRWYPGHRTPDHEVGGSSPSGPPRFVSRYMSSPREWVREQVEAYSVVRDRSEHTARHRSPDRCVHHGWTQVRESPQGPVDASRAPRTVRAGRYPRWSACRSALGRKPRRRPECDHPGRYRNCEAKVRRVEGECVVSGGSEPSRYSRPMTTTPPEDRVPVFVAIPLTVRLVLRSGNERDGASAVGGDPHRPHAGVNLCRRSKQGAES